MLGRRGPYTLKFLLLGFDPLHKPNLFLLVRFFSMRIVKTFLIVDAWSDSIVDGEHVVFLIGIDFLNPQLGVPDVKINDLLLRKFEIPNLGLYLTRD